MLIISFFKKKLVFMLVLLSHSVFPMNPLAFHHKAIACFPQ